MAVFFICYVFKDFNPRSHKGSDDTIISQSTTIFYFNPRSHKGSDRASVLLSSDQNLFQSTLPQGERQEIDKDPDKYLKISIHAPTRGATKRADKKSLMNEISIHAPTRGATARTLCTTAHFSFQSTLPQGERRAMTFFLSMCRTFQSTLPQGERQQFSPILGLVLR